MASNPAPCRHIPTMAIKSASKLHHHFLVQSPFSSIPLFLPLPACHPMPPTLLPATQPGTLAVAKPPSFLPLPILCRPGFLLDPSGKAGGALVVLGGLCGCGAVAHLRHCLLAHCVVGVLHMTARVVSDMSMAHGWSVPRQIEFRGV